MKFPWIKWYAHNWLDGTEELCCFDRGVYITICNLIYARGGPITEELIIRRCRDHWRAVRTSLKRLQELGKIVSEDGHVAVKKCSEVLQERLKNHSEASQNGIKGNQIKHLKLATRDGVAIALRKEEEVEEEKKETRASRAPSNSVEFDRWWAGYPDKVGKGAARKAFHKALTKTSLDQLLAGIERYKATKPPDRPWCNPATWLNQERWLDVPAESSCTAGSSDVSLSRGPSGPPPPLEGIQIRPGQFH